MEMGWLGKAREVIESQIGTYPDGATLRDDPIPSLHAQLAAFQQAGHQANAAEVIMKLKNENGKRQRWAFKNSLRRHNHLGLLHALLLGLAKAGKLDAAKEGMKKTMRERREWVAEMRAKGVGAGGMDED
ncbi:hypothetical protein PILCRDRAFT_93377 [Piloderma croceum F 1598]|uniref:UCH37-like C-terminal domain-containing protein n=1 Tax=Piloderma croceum (strain F 1598) TaxID=765440 RepID=A0A0C3B5V3_PILCF|nr:hypothetical protein PILCRDRAFT_93377 [Piloderma croceum F 1598]